MSPSAESPGRAGFRPAQLDAVVRPPLLLSPLPSVPPPQPCQSQPLPTMPFTSPTMDAAVATATRDPWHALPSLAFMAATSSEEVAYSAVSGYPHRPEWPSSPAELDAARKMTLDDIHDLWSSSKLICVIAALQLVEQGKVDLKGDAAQWVPELRTLKRWEGFEEDGTPRLVDVVEKVTVEQMICHTMG